MKPPVTIVLEWIQVVFGGRGGIRTHGRLPYTAFRVRLVMTTSILFRISFLALDKIHDYNKNVNSGTCGGTCIVAESVSKVYRFGRYMCGVHNSTSCERKESGNGKETKRAAQRS